MKGKPMSGPIRDETPCKYCTDERHTACHDTCKKFKLWTEEKDRVVENRRKYDRLLGNRGKNRK